MGAHLHFFDGRLPLFDSLSDFSETDSSQTRSDFLKRRLEATSLIFDLSVVFRRHHQCLDASEDAANDGKMVVHCSYASYSSFLGRHRISTSTMPR